MNDLKFAFRQTLKHKGSSLLAVLILALGIGGTTVAPNFFGLLELRPIAGRTFLPGEGSKETGQAIVIGEGLWQQYFGGDAHLIGRNIELDGKAYLVVGIMPSNVQFPFGSGYSQFWVPHVFTSEETNGDSAPRN